MTRYLLLPLALMLALTDSAVAHKLKVFATVEGDAVTGYAFFIGGGRARGSPWSARTADGTEIAAGETDPEGTFRLVPPEPVTSDITITVDTREGHIASAVVAATRLGALSAAAAAPAPAAVPDAPPPTDDATAAMVEAAVQRQVEPLLERIEQMDSRLRFTDILSGVFLILGLAGVALWARGRSR